MLKKAMVAAATAASVVGMAVAAAPQALAIGNDDGPTVANGNGAVSSFGNSATKGNMSPQLSLVQGSLNKPCLGVQDVDVAVDAAIGATVQDIPVLSDHLQQQCSDNSTNAKRDGGLSHVLEDLSVLSANGES
ncbi:MULTISPECIES: rodlin [unclassified Streptomyces]|uniref:rodlin n=1 Tax=unclassified Streptomyces TaxID=2593676 RepID=UPI0004C25C6F|nr:MULTISPECIES: rodlin [unclassified Streptomyces]